VECCSPRLDQACSPPLLGGDNVTLLRTCCKPASASSRQTVWCLAWQRPEPSRIRKARDRISDHPALLGAPVLPAGGECARRYEPSLIRPIGRRSKAAGEVRRGSAALHRCRDGPSLAGAGTASFLARTICFIGPRAGDLCALRCARACAGRFPRLRGMQTRNRPSPRARECDASLPAS